MARPALTLLEKLQAIRLALQADLPGFQGELLVIYLDCEHPQFGYGWYSDDKIATKYGKSERWIRWTRGQLLRRGLIRRWRPAAGEKHKSWNTQVCVDQLQAHCAQVAANPAKRRRKRGDV
jgi:hypothetical protein